MLYTLEVAHDGRVYNVRSMFPVPPLRGDFLVYPGHGVGRDDDLLIEVTARLITVAGRGNPRISGKIDPSTAEDVGELLEAFGFMEATDA